jgi:hypothetical protein
MIVVEVSSGGDAVLAEELLIGARSMGGEKRPVLVVIMNDI